MAMIEAITKILGRRPDKTFGSNHWWANCGAHETISVFRNVPTITVHPVYYRPEMVEGGQKYDIHYKED